jgi:membrane-associated phospholipid phosphatase
MRVASILSLVGHPFVLVPLTIAFMVRPAKLAIAIATCMVVAMLAVIAWRVASGRWSDYDVSDAQQRHGFYPVALLIVIVTTIVSWLLHMPPGFLRGMFVAIGMLATGAVLTRYTKVSLHVMIGAFCATILSTVDIRAALLVGLLVLAVAWSRVVLRRHTVTQVILGAIMGGAFGVLLIVVNGRSTPTTPPFRTGRTTSPSPSSR